MERSEESHARHVQRLRDLLRRRRDGSEAEQIRSELAGLVDGVALSDLLACEIELLSENEPFDDLRELCRLREEVLGQAGRAPAEWDAEAGHPLDSFRRENEALLGVLDRVGAAMAALDEPPSDVSFEAALADLRRAHGELAEVDAHFRRKEFLLFTRLELHGIVRAGRVLWALDDDIRQWLKYVETVLAREEVSREDVARLVLAAGEPLGDDLRKMIFAEERLLLPLAANVLTEEDWASIWRHSPGIGWSWIEPGDSYRPLEDRASASVPSASGDEIRLSTGRLSAVELERILALLPADLTFVGRDGLSQFFSEGPKPIFYRSPATLGRELGCCHPPRSEHYARQIEEDFREGREDVAEFWKYVGERFVYVRFVAVRDEAGEYLGTLEFVQDIGRLRELEGQKLQLEYGEGGG